MLVASIRDVHSMKKYYYGNPAQLKGDWSRHGLVLSKRY